MPDAPLDSSETAVPAAGPARPPVVVGWVQAGPLDECQKAAFQKARGLVKASLRHELPDFAWAFPLVKRPDLVWSSDSAQSIDLLDGGATERRLGGWDFVLIVTAADLHAWHRPFALAAPSHALDAAVMSVARLDLDRRSRAVHADQRADTMAHRLAALALHSFGHLNGLPHESEPAAIMHAPLSPSDLDDSGLSFTDSNRQEIAQELSDVADPRMEEDSLFEPLGDAAFAVKAILLNWADIADTVLHIRPWRFPFQLSKLTTAAFSTLVVLIITAEAWDLGTRQPFGLVVSMTLVAIAGTSGFLVHKQSLLARRHGHGRSEQYIVQSVSILLSLAMGMATTWLVLFGTALLLGGMLFDDTIVSGWAANLGHGVGLRERLVFAGFVASMGIGVGALGASFEDQRYFRHVAYVDEET